MAEVPEHAEADLMIAEGVLCRRRARASEGKRGNERNGGADHGGLQKRERESARETTTTRMTGA
jgi:hypothetical protein